MGASTVIKINLGVDDNLWAALHQLTEVEGEAVTVVLPEESPLLKNSLDLRFLSREAKKLGKQISWETADKYGQQLIKLLENGGAKVRSEADFGFVEGDVLAQSPSGEKRRRPGLERRVKLPGGLKIFGLVLLAVFILGGVLAAVLYFLPRAKITLRVNSELLVKNVEVSATNEVSEVDTESRRIPAVRLSVTEKDLKSTSTTGAKVVGERAAGEVAIYNKTDAGETFAAGTELTLIAAEEEPLTFLTDTEVTVEGRTTAETLDGEEITYGQTTVEVTAAEIGSGYNLKEDEKFTIADHDTDDFLAQNEKDFSGGLSRQVAAVTKEDQDRLREALTEVLKIKAEESLKGKLVGDQKLAEGAIQFTVLEEVFDHEVDEEADRLGLTTTLTASTLVYSESKLMTLLEPLLSEFVPPDYTVFEAGEGIELGEVVATPVGNGDQELKLQVKIRSYMVPRLEENRIKKELAGLSLTAAQDYLSRLPSIASFELTLWPPLPRPLMAMPRLPVRIELEVIHD